MGIALVVAFALVVDARDDATTSSRAQAPGQRAQLPAEVRALTGDGNVVLEAPRGEPATRTGLERLVGEVTGAQAADQDALLQAGQGMVVREGSQATGVLAYGGDRLLRAPSPDDPQLLRFVEYWLGRRVDG